MSTGCTAPLNPTARDGDGDGDGGCSAALRQLSAFLKLVPHSKVSLSHPAMATSAGSLIIEDVFEVQEQDPDGKKFEKGKIVNPDGSRPHAQRYAPRYPHTPNNAKRS